MNKMPDKKDKLRSQLIIDEWNLKNGVPTHLYQPDNKQFTIPAVNGYSEKNVSLSTANCEYKQIIFSALYTANYLSFFTDNYAESNKEDCHKSIAIFIDFLNIKNIDKESAAQILKEFESYRVNDFGVKSQSTNLDKIIRLIRYSLDYKFFVEALSDAQYRYLIALVSTKIAPMDEVSSFTLTEWFSFHSWLRLNDIGIGNELFNRLASPKALMSSFVTVSEEALYNIQQAKYALIEFLIDNDITPQQLSLPPLAPKKQASGDKFNEKKNKWKKEVYPFITKRWQNLHRLYNKKQNPEPMLTLAFEMILYSWCNLKYIGDSISLFANKLDTIGCFVGSRQRFITSESWLFSHQFLYALSIYAHSDRKGPLPICNYEYVLFQWLMAYQSVQSSDVSNLRLEDFNFLVRRNGSISSISSSYFKGRAQDTQHLKDIAANTTKGKAILSFIDDSTAKKTNHSGALCSGFKKSFSTKTGITSIKTLIHVCATSSLRPIIDKSLKHKKVTPVFIEAFYAILKNGITFKNFGSRVNRMSWLRDCESPCKNYIFGLSAIKNSAIHARSDSFTPTSLINYNSHTNTTESKSYRNANNPEWLNSCGRVTRVVMQDMYINVFAPSKSQMQIFHSEFTHAVEIIKTRTSDVLCRLNLITGQQTGHVDELGFVTSRVVMHEALPDTIYLEDSPETVMKFHHYVSEFNKKHKILASKALNYLLFTALPTAEYISTLLHEKRFSKKSLDQGYELYKKYADILPPHFTVQIG